MKKAFLLLGLLVCTAMVSCVQENIEEPEDGHGNLRKATINLNLSVQKENTGYGTPESKADDTGTTIEQFYFLEYDASNMLIGKPKFYNMDESTYKGVEILLPDDEKETFMGMVVAVTGNIEETTLDEIYTYENCKNLNDFYKLYDNHYTTLEAITTDPDKTEIGYYVSGSIKIKSVMTSEDQNCTLTRNLTKFTFNFTNSVEIFNGVTIYSVQLHNVPKENYYYLNNAPIEYASYIVSNEEIGKHVAATPETPAAEEDGTGGAQETPAAPAQNSWTFYFPQNTFGAQGTHTNVTAKQKNSYAPDKATYIELWGRDDQGSLFTLRFFPGADDYSDSAAPVSDFNLKANNSYTLSIVLKSHFSANDTRIYNVQKEVLKPSNSYIIKQTATRYNTSLYAIPMEWMYKYWTKYAAGKSDNFFTDGEELVAEVIWQTQPSQVISFCDDTAMNESDQGTVKINLGSKDKGYLHFRTDAFARGNILVGVRRPDAEEYLWSWHLWVTDYNPDMLPAPWTSISDDYIFNLPNGGEVHRYVDFYNSSVQMWDINGGSYYGKYIMDRNLGAITTNDYGFYYQYGRKDPIPSKQTTLYNIKGMGSPKFQPTSGDVIIIDFQADNIDESVNNPHTFFKSRIDDATAASGWRADDIVKLTPWYNPEVEAGVYSKGIFDPCPPGWTVPHGYTWTNFSKAYLTGSKNSPTPTGDPQFYISKNPGTWVNKDQHDPIAFYPKVGRRAAGTGASNDYASVGYYWSASPLTGTATSRTSYNLYIPGHDYVQAYTTSDTAYGLAVRCIQEYVPRVETADPDNNTGSGSGNSGSTDDGTPADL